jgi:hypothetical protein
MSRSEGKEEVVSVESFLDGAVLNVHVINRNPTLCEWVNWREMVSLDGVSEVKLKLSGFKKFDNHKLLFPANGLKIVEVDISGSEISRTELSWVMTQIKALKSIRSLNLFFTKVEAEEILGVINSSKTLTDLNLSHNNLGDRDIKLIETVISKRHVLERINLKGNLFEKDGYAALRNIVELRSKKKYRAGLRIETEQEILVVKENIENFEVSQGPQCSSGKGKRRASELGGGPSKAMREGMASDGLLPEEMDFLEGCNTSTPSAGAHLLDEMRRELLDLDNPDHQLVSERVNLLLLETPLEVLDVADPLEISTQEELSFEGEKITQEDFAQIQEVLKGGVNIKVLNLKNCEIDSGSLYKLTQSLKRNTTLNFLRIEGVNMENNNSYENLAESLWITNRVREGLNQLSDSGVFKPLVISSSKLISNLESEGKEEVRDILFCEVLNIMKEKEIPRPSISTDVLAPPNAIIVPASSDRLMVGSRGGAEF